jgi:hypothetical protein|tara:strand:+ start:273 stop:497 length:225 start_codon:yes stop_codon:yes gene_type:complete
MITLTKVSPLSGFANTMTVDCDVIEYALWQRGMLIQDAMPDVSVDEREFLISGIYPGEWEELATVRGAVYDPDN